VSSVISIRTRNKAINFQSELTKVSYRQQIYDYSHQKIEERARNQPVIAAGSIQHISGCSCSFTALISVHVRLPSTRFIKKVTICCHYYQCKYSLLTFVYYKLLHTALFTRRHLKSYLSACYLRYALEDQHPQMPVYSIHIFIQPFSIFF